jgi:predicted ATPase
MLVAISGSQGAGKTTTLEELHKKGFNIVETKIARSILKDWDMDLSDINSDLNLQVEFQEEVTKRKFEIEHEYATRRDDLWFTERTHADVFTYTLIILGAHNKFSNWLDSYYDACLENNQMYDMVFYLRGGHFDIEHDGTRGSNRHYGRMVDLTMLDLTRRMTPASRLSLIDVPSLEQRIDFISMQIAYMQDVLKRV